MEENKNNSKETQQGLNRELGVFQLTMMGAGMMIGAGVFVATGIAIGTAGPGGILLAFALNGLIALFTAMAFAELCSAMPEAGGAYAQVKKAFGGFTGYISGWMNWFALAVAGSLYAITFSKYTLHLLKTFEFFNKMGSRIELIEKFLAVAVALFFIMINYRGVSDTGKSSTIIALGQTVTLGIIGVLGVAVAMKDPTRLTNFSPFTEGGGKGILLAMGFTYVGFEGFEVIGHAGEEAIDPRKNVPKAILYAVVIVVSTYLLVGFAAVIGAKPVGITVGQWFAERQSTGFADAIQALFPFGGILVTFAAIFSSTSALNATLFSSARVSFAMSRDGFLPQKMTRISKNHVPSVALGWSSAIVIVVVLLLDVESVAAAADIMFLLLFMLVNVSVIKIRKDMGDELNYGFLMPFFPAIPIIALVLQLALAVLLFEMSQLAWVFSGMWILVGTGVYFTYAKKRGIEAATQTTLEEEMDTDSREYQVMLPVRSGGISDILAKYAGRLAEKQNGELLITRIIAIPHYKTDEEAREGAEIKRGIVSSTRKAVDAKIPIHSIIGRSETAARGIVEYIRERGTDMVVLGWKGYTNKLHYQMGNTIDRVIERAPCDIMVVKPGTEGLHTGKLVKKILIPSNGSNHALLAAKTARAMIDVGDDAEITILNINTNNELKDRIIRRLQPMLIALSDVNHHLKIIDNKDVSQVILEEAKTYDLLILGASNENLLSQLLFGKMSEIIASQCDKTVILVKRDMGIQSFIRRWLGHK
jgi:amino acid transporter/nucleotide-binding universal stress UspA family protein